MSRSQRWRRTLKATDNPATITIQEGYLTCPSCGQTIEESFNLCPFCGASVCTVCSGCGKEIKIHWTLCPYCGKPAYEPSSYIDKAEELLKTGEYDRALEYVGLGKELYRGNSELRDLEDRIQQQKRAAVYDALVSRGFDLEEKGNILSAIRLYESANKIQKKESLTKRIESLRLRLEEENRFKLVNEAKAYAETARGYEEKGKLGAAIRFYKKANERYGDEEIEGKISSLEEERHRKWRRYGNWTLAVSAAAIIITIALIVIFTLLGGVGEETQDIVEEQAEHETISEEADETIPASRATGAVWLSP